MERPYGMCSACQDVNIDTPATVAIDGEGLCQDCADERHAREFRTGYFCSVCGNEVEEFCRAHPQALVDAIRVPTGL